MLSRTKIKVYVLIVLTFFATTDVSADWIDEYVRGNFQEARNSLSAQYPDFTAYLTMVIKKMEKVVNDALPPDAPKKVLKQLYLFHSSKQEKSPCVVWTPGQPAYAVFIGSDFLKRLFRSLHDSSLTPTQKQEKFRKDLEMLMGVIAHEMGHVMAEGSNHHHHHHDQDIETQADKMGIMLLRKAGLSREGVINVMDFIAKEFPNPNTKKHSKVSTSAYSTHPQGEVRKSAARMNTVLDVFQYGTYEKSPDPNIAALMTELSTIPENASVPATLLEAMDRVEHRLNELPALQQ